MADLHDSIERTSIALNEAAEAEAPEATMTSAPSAELRPSMLAESNAALFLNRELSWLEFNRRVLEEAADRLLDFAPDLALRTPKLDDECEAA